MEPSAAAIESAVQRMAESNPGGLPQEPTDYRKTYDLVVKDLPTGPMEDASAARMLDLVMMQAIRDRASDIHFEPDEKALRVRLRIDGFLYESLTLPKPIQPALTSRIKILAEMDIAETRLPQDGNFNVKLERRGFEIRVSTFPTIHGENVVLRILDQTSPLFKLDELGFSEDTLNQFKQLVRRTNGIILVTGPTGSGKTTTLYALLNMINSKDKNIITIEDPVEYRLALIRQTQINPKAGITFATGLRIYSASRPGHHYDRRDQGFGNLGNRHASSPDRPPGIKHVTYERRPRGYFPTGGYRRGTLSHLFMCHWSFGPTIDSHPLPGLQSLLPGGPEEYG